MNAPKRITCRELIQFLDDYHEANQPADVRARFEAHLAVCADCRRYLATYRETIGLARASCADEDSLQGVPPVLVNAVLKALS
jgi:anti-sigma factor RsiW